MYKLISIVYFSQKQDKNDINKLNRQECKIIATTGFVPMAKSRKKNGMKKLISMLNFL